MNANDDALRCAESLEGKRVYDDSLEWAETLDESAAHIRRLVAENEAQAALLRGLRRDAERYQHLRDSAARKWRNGPGLYWHLPHGMPGDTAAEQLDASIDAAIRKHLEGK